MWTNDSWTPVETFERDGRRFVLAIERAPDTECLALLSAREREVVKKALLGHDNKTIAFELGLAHSTVRVLMARAASKAGAGSRRELLRKAAWLNGADASPRS